MATSTPAADGLAASISGPQRVVITIAVMLATIMEVLDTSIVNVALPIMQGELGATLDEISWVSTGYIISNVIVLPLTGWLSDFFGRKRYLFLSVIVFTLASCGCGVSNSLWMLVMFRILQGVGGAAFLSTAQATLMEIYPPHQRGFAQALFGMGVVMAPTLGPTLGGFLVDNYAWPWIFNVNIPVGIICAILIRTHVPDSAVAGEKRSADLWGIGLLALGLGSLQTVLEKGQRDDWLDATYIRVLLVIAVAGLVAFVMWSLSPKNRFPAIDLRVLKNRNLVAGSACAAVLGFAMYGLVLLMPQFWQVVQNHSAQQTGMLLFPGGLATAAVMPFVGRLINIVDTRALIAVGMVLQAGAMGLFLQRMDLSAPDSVFAMPLIVRGVAIGLQFVPLSAASLGTLKPHQLGAGAGIYNLFRQLGGSFGIALMTTMLERRQTFHYKRLAEYITPLSVATQERIAMLSQGFMSRGMGAHEARQQALAVMAGGLHKQAAVLSYGDIFMLLIVTGLSSLLLLGLFQRSRNKVQVAAH